MWGVAERFMAERPELAQERALLNEANERLGTGAALAFADLTESVATGLAMGMSEAEIASLLRVFHEYMTKDLIGAAPINA